MKKLILALTLLPFAAQAEGIVTKVKTVDCYCTDSGGARIELGESICCRSAAGCSPHNARCP